MDRSAAAATPAKAAPRGEALARRDRLDPAARNAASTAIGARAIAIVAEARPVSLAAYLPIRSECDPGAVIAWASQNGIATALPAVVDDATIVFRRYRPGDPLAPGGLGTRAPSETAPAVDPDMIIAPVIAFDRTGARLGHGRGFYDRAIGTMRARGLDPLIVGVAFAVQEVANIPIDPHDVHLDWIVTENETLDVRRAR
jgi:5-formyltetrahydrofolate cyclo-ligase